MSDEHMLYIDVPDCPGCDSEMQLFLRYIAKNGNFIAWRCENCNKEFDSYRNSEDDDWRTSLRSPKLES